MATEGILEDARLVSRNGETYLVGFVAKNVLQFRPWEIPLVRKNCPALTLEDERESSSQTPNVIEKYLKEYNLPLTRENYLAVAFLGESPEVSEAEVEAEISEECL